MSQLQSPFVLYPLGKLYPIIPELAQLLSITNRSLVENWENAANNDDIQTMLSVAIIANHWK